LLRSTLKKAQKSASRSAPGAAGWHCRAFALATRYPLGLFVAWSYLQPAMRCLVYPQPIGSPLPPPSSATTSGERSGDGGQEDFAGFRERQPADSPRHVAWKASARDAGERPLLVKQFAGGAQVEMQLDWAAHRPGAGDLKPAFRHLTGWVLAAEAAGCSYGLRLPGQKLPGSGDAIAIAASKRSPCFKHEHAGPPKPSTAATRGFLRRRWRRPSRRIFCISRIWLSAWPALMLFWGGWLWWQNQRLPGRWLLILLVVAGCAGIFLEFRTLFGRDAGVAMLVMFMAMKLLEVKSQRDAMVVVTLGYFLLLTHYFNSQSIPTGLWLLAALWLSPRRWSACMAARPAPCAPPCATPPCSALQAIPFMLVLYVLFPRINGPLWGLPQDAHSGKTGLSDTMSPGSISSLAQSGDIAFPRSFRGRDSAKQKLYWRGPVMENSMARPGGPSPAVRLPSASNSLRRRSGYETTLEAHNQRWLLALDAPGQPATGNCPEWRHPDRSSARTDQPSGSVSGWRPASITASTRTEDPAVLRRNLACRPAESIRKPAPWPTVAGKRTDARGDHPGKRSPSSPPNFSTRCARRCSAATASMNSSSRPSAASANTTPPPSSS
jgi:uncharacterized membrane protein YtjA (UPF0391 family)